MKTLFVIETHVYAEDHLCDEILEASLGDDINSCGVIAPETIIPLRKNRNPKVMFEYTSTTTLRDVVRVIYDVFGVDEQNTVVLPQIAFLCGNVRYWIDDIEANFQKLVEKHLDIQNNREIRIGAYVSADAGMICEEEGIRYYMNSRERGKHHEPHIHLRALNSCEEAVIIIKNREVIGDFPRKLIKKARKKVIKNERFFLEQWNVLTDGLKVDINHYFGLINY